MNKIPKILVVDDDITARKTVEMLLMREKYELIFAEDGAEAFMELDDMDVLPDAILLDVMMPEMDGFEVCQRLKRHTRWGHIPIILVTALDSKEDLARGLEAGADDFLHKPVNGLELRARVRSMLRIKQRQDDLTQMLKMREELSHMIVHDIRGPLGTIQVFCDLLREKVLPDGVEELDTIQQEAGRLSSFLTDMLIMAKMDYGRLSLNRAVVDVAQLVATVQKNYQPLAQLKKIHLTTNLPTEGFLVTVDINLFQRVIENLVSNAIKFSPAEAQVTITVSYSETAESGKRFQLQIADEGPGIPAKYRETIFEKFRVVETGRNVPQVGLGLAFCKMVIEAHNGRIYLGDNHPKGTIFTVEI